MSRIDYALLMVIGVASAVLLGVSQSGNAAACTGFHYGAQGIACRINNPEDCSDWAPGSQCDANVKVDRQCEFVWWNVVGDNYSNTYWQKLDCPGQFIKTQCTTIYIVDIKGINIPFGCGPAGLGKATDCKTYTTGYYKIFSR